MTLCRVSAGARRISRMTSCQQAISRRLARADPRARPTDPSAKPTSRQPYAASQLRPAARRPAVPGPGARRCERSIAMAAWLRRGDCPRRLRLRGIDGDRLHVALVGTRTRRTVPAINAISSRHGWRLRRTSGSPVLPSTCVYRNLALKRVPGVPAMAKMQSSHAWPLIHPTSSRLQQPGGRSRSGPRTGPWPARPRRSPGCSSAFRAPWSCVADIPAPTGTIPGACRPMSGHPALRRATVHRVLGAMVGVTAARPRGRCEAGGPHRAVCPSDPCPAVVRGNDRPAATTTISPRPLRRSLAPALDRALARILRPTSAPGARARPRRPFPHRSPTPRPDLDVQAGRRRAMFRARPRSRRPPPIAPLDRRRRARPPGGTDRPTPAGQPSTIPRPRPYRPGGPC